jgi:hypothetical protein
MFKKCVDFLNSHFDYSACGGQVVQLRVDTLLPGKGFKTYVNSPKSFDQTEALERMRAYFAGASGPYYFVVRTDVVRRAWARVQLSDYKNIRFAELVHDSTIIALGKVKAFNEPYYFRSLAQGEGNEAGLTHNFLDEILAPTWSNDLSKTLEWIKSLVPCICDEELADLIKIFITPRLINGLGQRESGRSPKISRVLINKAFKSSTLREIFFEYVSNSLARRSGSYRLELSTIEQLIVKYKKF